MAYSDKPTDFRQWGMDSPAQSEPVDYLSAFREFGVGGYKDPSNGLTTTQKWLGGTADNGISTPGYVPSAMNVGTGLLEGYLGMKKYGLAKKSFRQNKKEFNMNYDAQQQMTNTQLRDRQAARVSANPNAYESVDKYMKRNRVEDR